MKSTGGSIFAKFRAVTMYWWAICSEFLRRLMIGDCLTMECCSMSVQIPTQMATRD